MVTLSPNNFYHIYNHANGNENLFRSGDNYSFFLKKYAVHISPIADTFAYCLLPNHFHILVQIKDKETLRKTFPKFETLEKLEKGISKQFSNFFSS
jgi:predicted helicase